MLRAINPATGETVREFAELSATQVDEKLARAAAAFREHRRRSFAERAEPMHRLAQLFEEESERLGRLMTLEMGKPLAQAVAEAKKCAAACRYYAGHAEEMLAEEPVSGADGHCFLRFEPLGPVLALMPWNFPFWQVIRFAAPALMAGNVGLLKHADNVPQCGEALEELFLRAGFAEGCFQHLLVGIPAIEGLIVDPRVAAVTLTGSVAAGRAVGAAAGKAIKPCVLELGGSDPFLVLPSAPLEETVAQAVQGRVQNNGQSCIAAKRFIVHTEVYDEFAQRLTAAFAALRVGDPLRPETEVGPLAQAKGRDMLEQLVARAVKAGGRVLTGGARIEGPGFYYQPTVLAAIPLDDAVLDEEFFGPVALLFRVTDLDQAIQLANTSPFGLGASAWTRDPAEQTRAVRELETGQVFINGLVASQPALPFGGIKASGLGRELGVHGLRSFVNVKSVSVAD